MVKKKSPPKPESDHTIRPLPGGGGSVDSELFQRILDCMAEAMVVIDETGKFIVFNLPRIA